MCKEKNNFKASNAEKDRQIALLEAEMERAKEDHEAKTTKLMQASAKVVVNLNTAQVKIDDLKDEINYMR